MVKMFVIFMMTMLLLKVLFGRRSDPVDPMDEYMYY
jgi:hypothetical protein